MKVGVMPPKELKEKSEALQIPFADVLWGFLLENFLCRVYKSEFKDVLWLAGEDTIGVANYAKSNKERLTFYYIESKKTIPPEKLIPGQKLSEALLDALFGVLFEGQETESCRWSVACSGNGDGYDWLLTVGYLDMQVTYSVRFLPLTVENPYPKRMTFTPFMDEKHPVELVVYAPESRLSSCLFEIMKKLELIDDMQAYAAVNEILKTESVSGRHVLEELQLLSEKEPKILNERRMEQIAGYRDYVYMKKRWEQYGKRHGAQPEPWSEVVDRLVAFASPIWKALCRNEIFFDDWMPGLGRYLS